MAQSSVAAPQRLAAYPREQLLVRTAGAMVQTPLAASETAVAGRVIVGPVTILRERGAPQTETLTVQVPDPSGVFLLRLTNGDAQGRSRVSSAVITLNGRPVVRPAEFNHQVAEIGRAHV